MSALREGADLAAASQIILEDQVNGAVREDVFQDAQLVKGGVYNVGQVVEIKRAVLLCPEWFGPGITKGFVSLRRSSEEGS